MRQYCMILAATLGLVVPVPVWAQGAEQQLISPQDAKSFSNREWRQTIDAIKTDTQTLLLKNRELNTEYDFLQEKLNAVQDGLGDLRQEIRRQQADNESLKKTQKQKVRVADELKAQNSRAAQEAADLEKQNEALKAKLDEKRQETESMQDRLSELKRKKRQLTLDLKLKEFTKEDLQAEQDQALDDLKLQLQGYQKQEEELLSVTENLTDQKDKMMSGLDKIKGQMGQLEEKLAELRQDQAEQERHTASLQRELQRADASRGDLPAGLLKEKRVLEAEIARLERQIEQIRDSLQKSQEILKRKRELMDEIMGMDAENQTLRQEVSDLMKQLSALKGRIDSSLLAETIPQTSP